MTTDRKSNVMRVVTIEPIVTMPSKHLIGDLLLLRRHRCIERFDRSDTLPQIFQRGTCHALALFEAFDYITLLTSIALIMLGTPLANALILFERLLTKDIRETVPFGLLRRCDRKGGLEISEASFNALARHRKCTSTVFAHRMQSRWHRRLSLRNGRSGSNEADEKKSTDSKFSHLYDLQFVNGA
jgi:hypothetical protein